MVTFTSDHSMENRPGELSVPELSAPSISKSRSYRQPIQPSALRSSLPSKKQKHFNSQNPSKRSPDCKNPTSKSNQILNLNPHRTCPGPSHASRCREWLGGVRFRPNTPPNNRLPKSCLDSAALLIEVPSSRPAAVPSRVPNALPP